jgi:hypothetical protein
MIGRATFRRAFSVAAYIEQARMKTRSSLSWLLLSDLPARCPYQTKRPERLPVIAPIAVVAAATQCPDTSAFSGADAILLIQSAWFLTRIVVPLTRNVASLIRNATLPIRSTPPTVRDGTFLTRNLTPPVRDALFLTRNAAFPVRNVMLPIRASSSLVRNVKTLIGNPLPPTRNIIYLLRSIAFQVSALAFPIMKMPQLGRTVSEIRHCGRFITSSRRHEIFSFHQVSRIELVQVIPMTLLKLDSTSFSSIAN